MNNDLLICQNRGDDSLQTTIKKSLTVDYYFEGHQDSKVTAKYNQNTDQFELSDRQLTFFDDCDLIVVFHDLSGETTNCQCTVQLVDPSGYTVFDRNVYEPLSVEYGIDLKFILASSSQLDMIPEGQYCSNVSIISEDEDPLLNVDIGILNKPYFDLPHIYEVEFPE